MIQRIKAAPGRTVVFYPRAPRVGGRHLTEADGELEVDVTDPELRTFIRKRVRAGDLVVVPAPPTDTSAARPSRATTTAAKE